MSMGFAKAALELCKTIKGWKRRSAIGIMGGRGEVYHVRPKYDPCSGAGKAQ